MLIRCHHPDVAVLVLSQLVEEARVQADRVPPRGPGLPARPRGGHRQPLNPCNRGFRRRRDPGGAGPSPGALAAPRGRGAAVPARREVLGLIARGCPTPGSPRCLLTESAVEKRVGSSIGRHLRDRRPGSWPFSSTSATRTTLLDRSWRAVPIPHPLPSRRRRPRACPATAARTTLRERPARPPVGAAAPRGTRRQAVIGGVTARAAPGRGGHRGGGPPYDAGARRIPRPRPPP
ncbi:hypothetical protein QJS66_12500 [Kocuria rhizophila]|nr:hypothetical protein QJS66_12500 [Kocuria rhizophila]